MIVIWISDRATGGYLNMTPGARLNYDQCRGSIDVVEREQLLASGSTTDLSGDDLLQSQSDTRMRNRYLTRIGAAVCS